MHYQPDRRDFLAAASAAAFLATRALAGPADAAPETNAVTRLEPFDYQGVRLRPSRWQAQADAARETYLAISDDDILHGYRAAAGLPTPGHALGGWCGHDSSTVFGQWLSGLSRLSRATGDARLRDKAVRLVTEWAKTIRPDGDTGMRHYPFDKLVCGLVDLKLYADHEPGLGILERVVDFAIRNFDRGNQRADPSHNQGYYGRPQEWYTLAENLYRAYQATGNPKYRSFAEVWLYHSYWNEFADSAAPANAHGVHAYSHVNTFSSAAMAHEVTADPTYLTIIKNAHDYLQATQCYATGGYGPNERFMAPDGSLGRALDTRSDTCEIVCGSWAAFKLARYLTRFTGEAMYGDWVERLLYNGVGAALPLRSGGQNFYYADYRTGGGMKVFNWDNFTCCSGTYIQNMADYHNLIYYKDANGLYVSLYLPSEVAWSRPDGQVKVVQDTKYPEAETSTLTVEVKQPTRFALHFRVPGWSRNMAVKVNGAASGFECKPGTWATVERTWTTGDRVEVTIPLVLRMEAVDRQHPDRVAVVRGPVVLVLEGAYHDPNFRLPLREDELEKWLVPEPWAKPIAILSPDTETHDAKTVLRVAPPDGKPVRLRFRPFYDVGEAYPYFMYFDRQALPWRLW
jgi:DUF1680 family protein